ncbi:hypothetical protein FQA39_LY13581 [Lamprigera yunnana]|nr:hypothetical protein FQA39_LY13581 [Lamprigera yunnana]
MWMAYAEQGWTKAVDLNDHLSALEVDAEHEAVYGLGKCYSLIECSELEVKYETGVKLCDKFLQEPDTEIVGGPELFIDRGSTINLTCVVRHSPEPPAYIYWNHNDAILFKKVQAYLKAVMFLKLDYNPAPRLHFTNTHYLLYIA